MLHYIYYNNINIIKIQSIYKYKHWFTFIGINIYLQIFRASQRASLVAQMAKNLPALKGLISGLGESPGEGNGNPLQYSCLENPMDKGAWGAITHGVANSGTQLKWLSMHDKYLYL